MTFPALHAEYHRQVGDGLRALMDKCPAPEPLRSAMGYSLLAEGKRLRPVLLLGACETVGGAAQAALPYACAVEMIHAYSLIHDDLPAMDDDDFRRGKPTNHRVYGEGMAILAGDGLLSLAFEIMLNAAETPAHIAAMRRIAGAAGAGGMVAGQCADLACEKRGVGTADDLQYIHLHKTADMLIGAVTAGLLLGGASRDEATAGETYARALGLAFQMQDDLLDIEGSMQALGKATGTDAARGKLTWPGFYGIEASRRTIKEKTEEALAALHCFGERGHFLAEMARWLLVRDR